VTTAVEKMIPSAVRASCVCSREIWSMANSRSVLIAARSIRSGSGREAEKRWSSSGMRAVCQRMVAPWLTGGMRCPAARLGEMPVGPRRQRPASSVPQTLQNFLAAMPDHCAFRFCHGERNAHRDPGVCPRPSLGGIGTGDPAPTHARRDRAWCGTADRAGARWLWTRLAPDPLA
jgi:hypothetical protein